MPNKASCWGFVARLGISTPASTAPATAIPADTHVVVFRLVMKESRTEFSWSAEPVSAATAKPPLRLFSTASAACAGTSVFTWLLSTEFGSAPSAATARVA